MISETRSAEPDLKFTALSYRPEIDGLRALAVVAVVLFHAGLKCPGGYVGVDVFFVISGYLITALILRDLSENRFSLVGFWERRVRRIAPALAVMVLATTIVGGLVMFPRDSVQLGWSVLAQALLMANVFFWRQDAETGGYFAAAIGEERPLLHTWSLAVEEQFYLFLPLLLFGLFRFRRVRQNKVICGLFLVGGASSLGLAVYGVASHPGATFYLLPTRAWELLCGAVVAALPVRGLPRSLLLREVASWLGLLGVLLPCVLYSGMTPFPGLAALPPCLGAALIIWGNSRRDGVAVTFLGRLLAWRPVVGVGLISYSLYLWHWPVLVFAKYWLPFPWRGYFKVGFVILGGVLAVLSWRFVETPFRQRRLAPTRRKIFGFAGIVTLVALLAGACLVLSNGFPSRFPESISRQAAAEEDTVNEKATSSEITDIREGRVTPLGNASPGSPMTVLLWGDSHAQHAIPAMDALCKELGIVGGAAVHSSTPPLIDADFHVSSYEESPEFAHAVMDLVKRKRPHHVVLAACWSWYQNKDARLLERALATTIRALEALGCTVWVLQDVPDVDVRPTRALAMASLLPFRNDSWRRTIADHHRNNEVLYRASLSGLPAIFLDPAPLLLDAGSDRYRADIDGLSIYHDYNHLTTRASRALLLPLFREAMSRKFMSR